MHESLNNNGKYKHREKRGELYICRSHHIFSTRPKRRGCKVVRWVTALLYVARSCFLFELSPEHSPNWTYMNLTEDEEEKETEREEKLGQIEASYCG